jgi:phosphoadenosine phosphosulfate reductase
LESTVDIAAAVDTLEGRSPAEILVWSAERFAPRITFATAFGAEGCVLIDLIARHHLPIDVFTLDTGLLFPETYALWRRLEERYGLTIRAVRPELSLAAQGALHGDSLWERTPDKCCEIRKVAPLRRALAGFDAWITSIRRDQTNDRSAARVVERDLRFGLTKVNPLAGWTSEDVQRYVRVHQVPVNPLHARGYPSIGCMPCTTPVAAGEAPRAGRWRGSEKTECGLHARLPLGSAALVVSAS